MTEPLFTGNAVVQGGSRGIGLGMVRWLLDNGASRVFASSRQPWASAGLNELAAVHGERLELVELEVASEPSIQRAARRVGESVEHLHLLVNAAGLLHDSSLQPEKSLKDLSAASLHRSFAVNTVGPALMAKYFHALFRHDEHAVWANISARVGSIGDNRLGGWYGYRASKAAQNMITKTLAIELRRRAPNTVVIALHPGTVDTDLSAPFRMNVPEGKLFSVDRAVGQLMGIITGVTPEETGSFFAWDGSTIEW